MNWLQQFLGNSIRQNLCTKVGCTTCGAREFRHGLRVALAGHLNQPISETFTVNDLAVVGRALASIQADTDQLKFEAAVRLVITDIWNLFGDEAADRIVAPLLGDSWAGGLLARMKLHHAHQTEARRRRLEDEDPARVKENRDAKRELRQLRHAQRLDKKRRLDCARQSTNH
jgi:hypothetical protein